MGLGNSPIRSGVVALGGCIAGALLTAAPYAWSQQTINDAQCMQDRAGFALNCTANDVGIAGVAKNQDGTDAITIIDPCSQAGDSVTFTATFDVLLTAQARHDIGIYFSTDGDPNGDGALTGSCSVSTLAISPDPPWVDLDGTSDPVPGTKKPSGIQDTCGDIDANHNPLHPMITVTAICVDDDGDGFLDLPNCVSWRQSGANDLCLGPADTFPGAPSKCKCDAGFNVPVPVPAGVTLSKQVKLASEADSLYREEASLPEPGGQVTYRVTFTVTGTALTPDVTINSLTDNVYGNITQVQGDITATTCSVPQLVDGDGGSYSCSFTTNVSGNAGDEIPDIVTAQAYDDVGNTFSPTDDANVVLTDVTPAIEVTKTPSSALDTDANPDSVSLLEPGGDVTFSVVVQNTSSASSDPVTIDTLIDNVYGDLDGLGDCDVPQTIQAAGSYSCSFTVTISEQSGFSEVDTVTASGTDDDGNPVSDSDSATVLVLDVPSSITLIKTATPDTIAEPGANVTFSFTINNTSDVDSVTIDSFTDTIYGDLDGQGTCSVPQTILPGGSYSCSFTTFVAGNAGQVETNTATASGVDDDNEPVTAMDSADVNFTNVPPDASLTKTATALLVTYVVQVFNESTAEALTLNALSDDEFGNITLVQGDVTETNCAVPQSIAIGDSYSCTFKAIVTTSPHTNTVTGTIDDDDGSPSITESDSALVTFGDPPAP